MTSLQRSKNLKNDQKWLFLTIFGLDPNSLKGSSKIEDFQRNKDLHLGQDAKVLNQGPDQK